MAIDTHEPEEDAADHNKGFHSALDTTTFSAEKLQYILPWNNNSSIEYLHHVSAHNWGGRDYDESSIPTIVKEIAAENSRFESRATTFLADGIYTRASSVLLNLACSCIRIQAVLTVVDDDNAFRNLTTFVESGITDQTLPLSLDKISKLLTNPEDAQKFWNLQFWTLSLSGVLGNFNHVQFPSKLHVPLLHLTKLGHGTYASVDSVKNVMNNQKFARKIFHPIARRKLVVAGFQKEMEVIKRLKKHLHIVAYAGSYVAGSELGILLTPVADRNLREVLNSIADDGMSSENRKFLRKSLGCLMSGLAFMHNDGIRHKDIKPANILIHGNNVLFADFGLALDFDRLDTSATPGPTGPMTKRYSAREVHESLKRDTRADVYSLGCVFLEICTVLADLDLEVFEETLIGDSGGDSWWEEGVYAFNIGAIESQLTRIAETGMVGGHPVEWCSLMLKDDSRERPRIQALRNSIYRELRTSNQHTLHFCESCISEQEPVVSDVSSGWIIQNSSSKSELDESLPLLTESPKSPPSPQQRLTESETYTRAPPRRKYRPKENSQDSPRNSPALLTSLMNAPNAASGASVYAQENLDGMVSRLTEARPTSSAAPGAVTSTAISPILSGPFEKSPNPGLMSSPSSRQESFQPFELFFTWSMFYQLVNVYCKMPGKAVEFPRNALLDLDSGEKCINIAKMLGRALCLASALGDVDLVQRLLRADVKPNFSDELIQAGNLESPKFHLYPPLVMAALHGQTGVLTLLIKSGAEVGEVDVATGATALHLVAWKGSATTLDFLLDVGLELEHRDFLGETALFYALRRVLKEDSFASKVPTSGDINTLEFLISRHANLDAQNIDRTTALQRAAQHGHETTCKLLLDNGARPMISGHKGWNALHYATSGSQRGFNLRKGSIPIITELLERGVDINCQTKDNLTALVIAAKTGQEDVEHFLLQRGASQNLETPSGRLHVEYKLSRVGQRPSTEESDIIAPLRNN